MARELDSPRAQFVFQGVSDRVVVDFYNGRDLIPARALFNGLRDLKGLSLQEL